MTNEIHGLIMPKYGMVMTEGRLSGWRRDVGESVRQGEELVDIETEKVANVYDSPFSGILRRKLAADGESAPIGALFGVIASADVGDTEIDSFVEQFQAAFSLSATDSRGPATEIVDINGGYIRFVKAGDPPGRAVVLIHGFGGDLNSWALNQEALARSHAVYALDLPGHGGSAKNPHVKTLAQLAAAVESFLDAKGLSGVHLVGHSLGGAVATRIALDRPKEIVSLTLIAPVGLGQDINDRFIQGMVEADRRKEMQSVLEMLFHDPALVSRDMTMGVLKSKRIDGAVHCLRAIAAQCFPTGRQAVSLRDELAGLQLPVQVIWGLFDQIIPARHAAGLATGIGVHTFEETGHMAHLEKAVEVNELISRIINVD